MTEDSRDRGPTGHAAIEASRRPGRLIDWGLSIGALAATAVFSLWAPGAARSVGAWIGFAP